MKTIFVNQKYDQKKLNIFVQANFPNLSNALFYKTLRKKDIRINGKRIHENVHVHAGDQIDIYLSNDLLENKTRLADCIVYQDENILLVNKPIQLEVTGENSLTQSLSKSIGQSIFPCHRLDRNTNGLVLFAKNEESLSILLEKFKNGEIEKHYACQVYGIPKKDSETLTAYLFKDAKKSLVYISDVFKVGYRKIITSYKVIKTLQDGTSILDINLHTGRTHQIRAHLAHIGYPIIGDGKYGDYEINKQFGRKTQALCSYYLKFSFTSSAKILDYLNDQRFQINYLF